MLLAWACERWLPAFGITAPMRVLRCCTSSLLWLAAYGLLTFPLARGIGLRTLAGEFRWPGTAPPPEMPHTE